MLHRPCKRAALCGLAGECSYGGREARDHFEGKGAPSSRNTSASAIDISKVVFGQLKQVIFKTFGNL